MRRCLGAGFSPNPANKVAKGMMSKLNDAITLHEINDQSEQKVCGKQGGEGWKVREMRRAMLERGGRGWRVRCTHATHALSLSFSMQAEMIKQSMSGVPQSRPQSPSKPSNFEPLDEGADAAGSESAGPGESAFAGAADFDEDGAAAEESERRLLGEESGGEGEKESPE